MWIFDPGGELDDDGEDAALITNERQLAISKEVTNQCLMTWRNNWFKRLEEFVRAASQQFLSIHLITSISGLTLQKVLIEAMISVLVVGAGALGCDFLKDVSWMLLKR